VDVFQLHLKAVLKKVAVYFGFAFVEILQNCNIFNDGAWDNLTDKVLRDDYIIAIEHGKPLVFGKVRDKGIRLNGLVFEVVPLGNGVTEEDLIVHDERDPNPAYAFLLSRMDATPGFPPDRRPAGRRGTALRVARRGPNPRGHGQKKKKRPRPAAEHKRHVKGPVSQRTSSSSTRLKTSSPGFFVALSLQFSS
jgi:hypothetical protein